MTTTVRYTTINGEVIAEKRNGVRKQYVPDPLGSTVALLDNTQTQTDTFSYWPYGEVNTRTGTTPTPFQFVGTLGYYQSSPGKAYVRARYLDSQKGRWLTEDPIGFRGGDWNLLRYAASSPVTLTDPLGTTVYDCWCYTPVGKIAHRFISTHKCGTYGFFPNNTDLGPILSNPGCVQQTDDKHLNEKKAQPQNGKKKKPPITIKIPGSGLNPEEDGGKCVCTPLSNNPGFENALCKCMEDSAKNPPIYTLAGSCCIDWVSEMLDCACTATNAKSKAWTWFGGNCLPKQISLPLTIRVGDAD